MKRILISLFLTTIWSLGFGQSSTTYGLWADSLNVYHFLSINPSQQYFNHISTLQGVTGYIIGNSTFNSTSQQYIFKGSDSTGLAFIAIDASNGAILNAVPITGDTTTLRSIEVSDSTGLIYALWPDTTGLYHLLSIDLSQGVYNEIGPLADVLGTIIGNSAFNSSTNQYIFKGFHTTGLAILSLDASTGSIIENVPLTGDTTSLISIEVSEATGLVYGLMEDSVNQYHLISIDLSLGQFNDIGVVNSLAGCIIGNSTFNSTDNRYIIKGFDSTGLSVIEIDVTTANIISSFPLGSGGDTSLISIETLELTNVLGRKTLTKISGQEEFAIFPNPTTSYVNIDLRSKISSVEIFGLDGKKIKGVRHIEKIGPFKFDVSNIPSGLYIISIRGEDERVVSKKLIIEKRTLANKK